MRSKARWWRNFTLGLFLICSGAFAFTLATRPEGAPHGWRDGVLITSLTIGLCALCSLPFVQSTHRADLRLRRGIGVIARWSVPVDEWQQFVREEREFEKVDGVRSNLIDVKQRSPACGIDVIVGHGEIIVGIDHQYMTGLGRAELSGPYWISFAQPTLEFRLQVLDPSDQYSDRAVRVPVAHGAIDRVIPLGPVRGQPPQSDALTSGSAIR